MEKSKINKQAVLSLLEFVRGMHIYPALFTDHMIQHYILLSLYLRQPFSLPSIQSRQIGLMFSFEKEESIRKIKQEKVVSRGIGETRH